MSTCSIAAISQTAALLRQTALIIWDEALITHRYCYEAVDRSLQDIYKMSETPFGSIPIVFRDDFAQILPVIPEGHRTLTVDASL
jgi:ATP-dependent DNA helicase PIF1